MKRILFFIIFIGLFALTGVLAFFLMKPKQPVVFVSPIGNTTTTAVEQLRSDFLVYGYLPYWNLNKAQISSTLTHIAYFSLPIQADGHLLADTSSKDTGYRYFARGILEDLRARAPQAKIELTLTMMGQDDIPTFLATPSATPTLLSDLRQIIAGHPISGINVDIEYIRAVDETKRAQFSAFMKTLYTSLKTTNPSLHISVAVLADSAERLRLTDIKAIAPYTDHIVIMAYDFHRKSSQTSGANAPLYGGSDELWGKNIMSSAKMFTDIVPASKLILGVPFYGYEWSVTGSNPYNFTLPDSGAVATYERITKLLASGKATRHWDETSFTPYLLYMDKGKKQQIYYEDAQSLKYKLELVKQAGFGGIAIWALGYEGQTQELWNTIQTALK